MCINLETTRNPKPEKKVVKMVKHKKETCTRRRRNIKNKKPCYEACVLKIYRCKCGKYVDPLLEAIGYSKLLCKSCYCKAIKISHEKSIDMDEAIEDYILFKEVSVY